MEKATAINFKEQTILTIPERGNAPFHSGCKMYSWTCDDQPIQVDKARVVNVTVLLIFF
jgi:hypothetical protein